VAGGRERKTATTSTTWPGRSFAEKLRPGRRDPRPPKPWRRQVNRRADYDRFLDALTTVKAQAGIKNTATAFGLLLDLAER